MQVLEIEIKNGYSLYSGGCMPQSSRTVSQGKQLEATVMNTAVGMEVGEWGVGGGGSVGCNGKGRENSLNC